MNGPAVSIVVATYNYGHYLPLALDSIRAQTFACWEAIVIDDGSTDNTSQLIVPYLADPRFRYHRTDHLGQPAAKNAGIRLARGRYVAFLDADDLWLPEKLSRQLALFNSIPNVGVVYCRRRTIDAQGCVTPCNERALHRGRVLQAMFLDNFVCFSSSVVRRDVLDTIGLFDERLPLAIDYDLWLRAASNFLFDYVDDWLVYYRTGHANLSQRGEERLRIALGVMRRFIIEGGGHRTLSPSLIHHAFAQTYCTLGLTQRDRSSLSALHSYILALRYGPLRYSTWRGLAAVALPETMRRLVRRALGRPADWQSKPPLADVHDSAPCNL